MNINKTLSEPEKKSMQCHPPMCQSTLNTQLYLEIERAI